MVNSKRKELRKRTQEEIDKASSGESFIDSVKNTVFAMAKGSKEERKLDLQEGLTSLGAVVAGGLTGKIVGGITGRMVSDLEHASSSENNYEFQKSTISDEELLRNLEQAEISSGLSGPDVTVSKNNMEFGG